MKILRRTSKHRFYFGSTSLLVGDLNEIIDSTKKMGGKEICRKRLFLKDFLDAIGGIDLGFTS